MPKKRKSNWDIEWDTVNCGMTYPKQAKQCQQPTRIIYQDSPSEEEYDYEEPDNCSVDKDVLEDYLESTTKLNNLQIQEIEEIRREKRRIDERDDDFNYSSSRSAEIITDTYWANPEGQRELQLLAARRELKSRRKKYAWKSMRTIWLTMPLEVMEYITHKLIKDQSNQIGIFHLIPLLLWISVIFLIFGPINTILDFNIFNTFITRILLIGGIILVTYIFCYVQALLKVR